jgi:formylglycine-generating enzyme required for sulfatase activity
LLEGRVVTVSADCLNEGTVIAFLNAKLPEASREAVERHVAACSACSELVTWAAADAAGGARQTIPGALHPGTRVDRYQILEIIGRGGMGEVYAAYHPDLDRRIALKVVNETGPETADRRVRLLREARAIARLSHPNVITVYDAGTFGDRVYVAMEFVDGQTIDRWLAAAPRSWREILDVFVAAGRGLAAAHAAGIVHRDFKPQNVMIGRNGAVRVMDFGLALLAQASEDPPAPAQVPAEATRAAALPTVTREGLVLGTPAYMAPEQFKGDPAGARTDQFSFCVALYEALHGERPFQGQGVISLSFNITEGELRPPPNTGNIPAWVRRPILRGLRPDPKQRHPSMDALIAAIDHDPASRRRRRLGVAAATSIVLASLVVAWQATARRRAAIESEIAQHLGESGRATVDAGVKTREAGKFRASAFAAFDSGDSRIGEALWRNTRALIPIIDADYDRAERSLETASMLETSGDRHRDELAGVRLQHLLFAEDFRLASKMDVLEERLAAVDPQGRERKGLEAPAVLTVRTTPPASRIMLERYERDPGTGRRRAEAVGPLPPGEQAKAVAPGSYRLVIESPGAPRILYPLVLARGQHLTVDLTLPAAASVPKGFVYVPAGAFLYGDADEQWRTQFLNAVPIHRRTTEAYLIARTETTYREWIAFLEDLPASERARRGPAIIGSLRGTLSLRQTADGWRITLQPSGRVYEATLRESITYADRDHRTSQDWLQFPVGGISPDDVAAYVAWLHRSGRVPGARLCSELEWERAARGADDRIFPHGDDLAPDDANIDFTYGKKDGGYGPDEVGSHPESRSPFDVDDLVGNLMEIVASSEVSGAAVLRGGGYFYSSGSARSTNREPIPRTFRDVSTGFRVCASIAAK